MLKLSIIVPIYNVEQYLRKCVDSLLAQDMPQEQYEIILVDDGSTDNSGAIADEYAARNKNISVIHQANAGLSEARNSGIDTAKGTYIMFVDSDDYIEPNVLGAIVKMMDDEQLDVLRFKYQNINEQYQIITPNRYGNLFDQYDHPICNGAMFLTNYFGGGCYACQFALKRELTRIRFTRGRYFEDTDWTPRMLLAANRVGSTNLMVYNYLLRTGSITQSVATEKKRKVIDDKIWLISSLLEQKEQTDCNLWFEGMIANTVISTLTTIALNFYDERKLYIAEIQKLKVFPISKHMLTPAAQRKRLLINLSPSLFCCIVHFVNNTLSRTK